MRYVLRAFALASLRQF